MSNHLDMLKDEQKTRIEGHELLKYKFSPGNVYWIKKNNKLVRILKTGDYMDAEVLYKYMNKCAPLVLERLINSKWQEEMFAHFMDLKHAHNIDDQCDTRMKILNLLGSIFWSGRQEGGLIDLIHLGEKVFYKIPDDLARELYQGEMEFFQQNALGGMVAVIFSLAFGYMDFNLLSDVYHMSFLADYGLIQDKIDWNVKSILKQERKKPGDGIKSLGDHLGGIDRLRHFVNCPERSYRLVESKIKNLFHDSDNLVVIKKYHEALNGKGFPEGIGENQLSDMEAILISAARCFPFDQELEPGDGREFLKEIRKYISNRLSVALKSFFEGSGAYTLDKSA